MAAIRDIETTCLLAAVVILGACAQNKAAPWQSNSRLAPPSSKFFEASLRAVDATPKVASKEKSPDLKQISLSMGEAEFEPWGAEDLWIEEVEPEPEAWFNDARISSKDLVPQPKTLIFDWPIASTSINSLYGKRAHPIDHRIRFHYGVDLDGEYGETILATAPGRVVEAGFAGGHGRRVVIEHAGGYRSSYSHLSSILVRRGKKVLAKQALGLVGSSGKSTGAHLHFEITRYGLHLDPLRILGRSLWID